MSEPKWSLDGVPQRPGVYLFRDAEQRVLYVGKARNLRSRLTAYRRPGGDGRLGVWFLERDAAAVETIVTRTEAEALLLEDALIKQHKPPHNIRLKDDKSFLMIRVDLDERFPRLKFVRAHSPKQGKGEGRSRFFGPFASSRAVRRTLSDLHRVVPLRDCTDATLNNRSRPCLKYQIQMCAAPCVGLIDEPDYAGLVARAMSVLSGDIRELEEDLRGRMETASEKLEFELAAQWRDRLQALRRTVEGQGVRPRDRVHRDVLGLARRGERAVVHRLAFREGRLAESKSHVFRSSLPDEELLHSVLTALYTGGRRSAPAEIVLPCEPAEGELLEQTLLAGSEEDSLRLFVPRGGERGKMLEIAGDNARTELERVSKAQEEERQALERVARWTLLDPESPPEVIDCFDVSTTQGAEVVASRVRFRGGLPDRAGYRRYKVKGVEGQDDFASMKEVVGRSLKRGLDEEDLPDLIVVDGGAAQLAKALEARDEAGAWDLPIVGLAKARPERTVDGKRKGRTEERLYLAPDKDPTVLPRHDAGRLLLERLRDEAHRFAITFHRQRRGKIQSRLDAIPGVGEAKRKALLRAFGSAEGVKQASVEQLAALPSIGSKLARVISDHLHGRAQ
ncbi:MAG: excinuclease ABC subunit UvrC [Planctomycetota bacterium]